MIRCPNAKSYWLACLDFCKKVLGYEIEPMGIYEAIVFNTAGSSDVMLPETTRAFLRHAVGRYYAAVTQVHREGAVFRWQSTFHWALLKFRDAAMRWAYAIKLQFACRAFSDLTQTVADETLAKYPDLITFKSNRSTFHVTQQFQNAINAAEAAATTRLRATTGGRR